jgi:hypothetical protein
MWCKPKFSTYLLYEPFPPCALWRCNIIRHKGYVIAIFWIDPIAAIHVISFLCKSSIFLSHTEFLKCLYLLSTCKDSSLPTYVRSRKDTDQFNELAMPVVDPIARPLGSLSDTIFQASSYKAFRIEQRN